MLAPTAAAVDQAGCVVCPECGEDMNHPVKVTVETGHETTRVTCKGTQVEPRAGAFNSRGVIISVYFMGECGHAFSVTYQFHKGATGATVRSFGDLLDGDGFVPVATIWRD